MKEFNYKHQGVFGGIVKQTGLTALLLVLVVGVVLFGIGFSNYKNAATTANGTKKPATTAGAATATSTDSPKSISQSQANLVSSSVLVNPTSSSVISSVGSTTISSGSALSTTPNNQSSSSIGTAIGLSSNSTYSAPPIPTPPAFNTANLVGTIYVTNGDCTPPRACAQYLALFQATVEVQNSSGELVTSFTSNAQGHFSINLNPSTYTLIPESYNNGHTTAPEQIVAVGKSQLLVSIRYTSY